ncbi:MAG: hypothetical protein WA160_14935 [Pseudobdellovibrio sp.]
MKNILISAITILTFGISHAQTSPEALPLTTTSLASTMKAMSNGLKAVSAQSANTQMNENSAILVDQFILSALHAKDFIADSIASLPADQQQAAKAQYDKLLDDSAELGRQLAAAFRANNNSLATLILNQLVQNKKEGHSQFKN